MPLSPFGILTFDDIDDRLDAAANPPAGRARRTTTQNVNNNTLTSLVGSTIDFDNAELIDDVFFSFAATRSGLWHCGAVVEFQANATGIRELFPRINAVNQPAAMTPAMATGTTVLEFSREFVIPSGQLFAVQVRQTSGVLLTAQLMEMSMHLIAETP